MPTVPTTSLNLNRIAMEALRILINALRPTHCPTCGGDLKLSPTTNIPPKFDKADHPVRELHIVAKASCFTPELIESSLAAAMEQLAKEIADTKLTRCALMPLYPDSYRAQDLESGLSLLMQVGADAQIGQVVKFTVGLA